MVTRRSVLRGAALGAMAAGLPEFLTGCGIPAAVQTPESCRSTDQSTTQAALNFSNWPQYIDVKKKSMPTLEGFESQFGISVAYNADVNDNNEFFAKVQNQLADCQPIKRDIMVLTDWMAARMVRLGWLQKLDHAQLPNVDAHLIPTLQGPDWDPGRDYSVPWQSGFTGIAYNSKYTGEVGSFKDLMTRPDLKGKVSLLTEMRDTMGFMLRVSGGDPTKFDENDWGNAIDALSGFVDSGQIRRFTGNDYVDDLNAGNLVACEAWSGDVIAMQFDNPDIKWVVPDEGLMIWTDNMLVPNKADHRTNAEMLMNYYYEPEVAATLAAWVNYICPVQGAQDAMAAIDDSLVDQPLIFPDSDILSKAQQFMAVDDVTAQRYDTDFSQAIG